MTTTAWLILGLPLAGSILIGLLHQVVPARLLGLLGTAAIAGAFVMAVLTALSLLDRGEEERQVVTVAWDYARTVGVDAQLSLLLDPLAIFMALVVSGVSTLIHLYSISYMRGEQGYTRIFSDLHFFVFSMCLLILAGNFLHLRVGWPLPRPASYPMLAY